ncbi:anaerobic C4-dicarboxylate transporter [Dysgonomonadaceae bacterium PH5-43]|nr:anaerobic C4-dicarboxylate transporter [Dysgonomonadaceae bacterium PH5-43]
METNLVKMMLPFKIQQLLETIIDKRGFNLKDALQYLYSSELYKQMSEDDSYLWQLSTPNLYDMLKKEKSKQKHKENNSGAVLLFLAFCIENYQEHKKLSVEETLFLFNKYGVVSYLADVFDMLHTQGKDYIMSEIDEYINNRRI